MRILSVVSVAVEKKCGYSYLKEIVVRRADQQLYKFKERDFPDLHLNNIKYMLLLLTQNKLLNLDKDFIVHLGVALHMFTRGIVPKGNSILPDLKEVSPTCLLKNYILRTMIYKECSRNQDHFYFTMGFAVALAVLITEASQSRQHVDDKGKVQKWRWILLQVVEEFGKVLPNGGKDERLMLAYGYGFNAPREPIIEYQVLGPMISSCSWLQLCPLINVVDNHHTR
ncbi:hypothetical protein Tco_0898117 [Tanacetum coccineum]